MSKDVFISYKSEEFEEASWVKSVLESNGISCWMAPSSIPGGSNYAIEIPQAIKQAKVFVLILSSKAQSSQWISREVDRAINEGKIVLPFMLENCALKDDFNFYLTNVQRYAAYENKTKAIEKMLREIKAVLGIKDVEEKPQEPTPTPENTDTPSKEPDNTKTAPVKKPVTAPKTKVLKDKSKKKINKKLLLTCVAVVAAIAIVVGVVLSVLSRQSGSVLIADQEFKADTFSVRLEDKTLTAEDMKKFAEFEYLDSIELKNCTLPSTDISVLFSSADALSLNNCGITNEHLKSINFEETYHNFSLLELDNNKEITDLSMIDDLDLYELSFNNCSVSDLSFLNNMPQLTSLSAENNGISDLSAIGSLDELTNLNLANNKINSLLALAECKKLTKLNVNNNDLGNLFGLENCLYLSNISAKGNKIFYLEGLKNATQLEVVDLSENNIINISLLSKSSEKLSEVTLNNNRILDLSPLSSCGELYSLVVDNNILTNLDALSQCSKLRRLSASKNQIADIKGIKNCKLSYVNLAGNKITATDSISLSGGDNVVDLSNNQISKPVLPGSNYTYLALYGNPIADFSAINDFSGITLVFDYNANIDFDTLGKAGFTAYYIFGCPLDQQLKVSNSIGYGAYFTTVKDFVDNEKPKLGIE